VCRANGGTCANPCASGADCFPGNSCVGVACAPSPGLALFWRFEETSGSSAADSSGNGRAGLYTGAAGAPVPSADLPPLQHDNGRSRAFDLDARHAVVLDPMPAALKPRNEVTLSVWYRATTVDVGNTADHTPSGSEVVSGGDAYLLRIRAMVAGALVKQIAFSKRIGEGTFLTVYGPTPTLLDGHWHHLAGVTGAASGMRVYFDGVEVGASADQNNDVLYSATGRGFWVGRHGDGQTVWDFGGNIDEVRLYTRALSAKEIARLAQGFNE
jgi:hypothetical protein